MKDWVAKLRSQFKEMTLENASSIQSSVLQWQEIGDMRRRLVASRFKKKPIKMLASLMDTADLDQWQLTAAESSPRINTDISLDSNPSMGIRQTDREAIKKWFGSAANKGADKTTPIHEAVYKAGFAEDQLVFCQDTNEWNRDVNSFSEETSELKLTRQEASQVWRNRITHQNLQALSGPTAGELSSKLIEKKNDSHNSIDGQPDQRTTQLNPRLNQDQLSQHWLTLLEQTGSQPVLRIAMDHASSAFSDDFGSPAKQIGVNHFVNDENTSQVKGFLPLFETPAPNTEELLADLAMAVTDADSDACIDLKCDLETAEVDTESVFDLKQSGDGKQDTSVEHETDSKLIPFRSKHSKRSRRGLSY
jgi:hypothetical protein